MFRQITTEGVEKRLSDDNLLLFKVINNNSPALATIEVYQLNKYGSPYEIMKAINNESVILVEEVGDGDSKQISRLSVL